MDEANLTVSEYLGLMVRRWTRIAELTRLAGEAWSRGDTERAERLEYRASRVEERLWRQFADAGSVFPSGWLLPDP